MISEKEQPDLFNYRPRKRYPHAPGARDTDTSRAAADAMEASAPTLQQRVREHIKAMGALGATSQEIADALGIRYEAIQPRTSELRRLGLISDSGGRRKSRAKDKRAIVWWVI